MTQMKTEWSKWWRRLAGLAGLGVVFWLGYSLGSFHQWKRSSEAFTRLRAYVRAAALFQAITNFAGTYGQWPCRSNGLPDVTYGPGTQAEVFDALVGRDRSLNPAGKVFHVFFPDWEQGGELVDPWGKAYYITLDTDGDGVCTNARWGAVPSKGPLVWSEGPGPIRTW